MWLPVVAETLHRCPVGSESFPAPKALLTAEAMITQKTPILSGGSSHSRCRRLWRSSFSLGCLLLVCFALRIARLLCFEDLLLSFFLIDTGIWCICGLALGTSEPHTQVQAKERKRD